VPIHDTIIPLIHAPDDPGPDAELPVEPDIEPPPLPASGWSRLRQLFK
jgi:hypothetical protein